MLILRIKQAEVALADGRLDEAYELVSAPDVRDHRRGQDLAGKLARKLVERGRKHFDAGQLTQASGDCEKACRIGGNLPEAVALRATVLDAMLARQQDEQNRAHALAAAGKHIQRGELSIGQKFLNEVKDEGRAAMLLQDVAARRMMIDAVVERVTAALKRDDWEAAIDELAGAQVGHLSDLRINDLVTQTTGMLSQRIDEAIVSGRLDLAASLHRRMARIAERNVHTEHIKRVLEQCRMAWAFIQGGQPRPAQEVLRRLSAILPSAEWIATTLANLARASDATEQLRTGPLGLLEDVAAGALPMPVRPHAAPGPDPLPVIPLEMGESVGPKFLMQVDGVGSFMVLRQPRVTIGPVSSIPTPDVGLLADAQSPTLGIERVEEDYFLHEPKDGRLGRGKLLGNGERIAVTPRCRMTFRAPSAASTTAVLDLHSARLPRADVRHIILMDRELIIGSGPSAHVRCDEMDQPATLVFRDDRLWCQSRSEIEIDGKIIQGPATITAGSHVRVGAVTFVITRV